VLLLELLLDHCLALMKAGEFIDLLLVFAPHLLYLADVMVIECLWKTYFDLV
jgi:hypothetical protein